MSNNLNEKIVKDVLYAHYKEKITIRCGKSNTFAYDIKNRLHFVDIAVYLNPALQIAVLWDIKNRRENLSAKSTFLRLKNELPYEDIEINCIATFYPCVKTNEGLVYTKVVVMNFETLVNNVSELHNLLSFDEYDQNYPSELNTRSLSNDITSRSRSSTSKWNRDCRFRKKVLGAYGGKCAICRCSEEKLLQAAHIISVAEGGDDDPNNGICLCANHHLMLDNDLIIIDHNNFKLSYVSPSVKEMAWYIEFVDKYNSIILKRE